MSLEGNAFWDRKRNLRPYTLVSLCSLCHILQSLFWKIFIEIIVAHSLWTTSSSFIATTKSVTKSSLLTFGTPNVLNKHYWDNSKGNYKNLASKGLLPFARYIFIFYHFTTTIILIVDGENIVAYITLHYCSLIKTFLNVFKRKHPILPQRHHSDSLYWRDA